MVRYRGVGRPALRPAWGRGWARLPGRVGGLGGWYGRFRWGRFYAPNYTGWAYTTYSAPLRMTLYYDPETAVWFYLSPRYGCFLPYRSYQEIEVPGA